MSTVNTEKLTLKLAPEVAKVLPWLIRNKVDGKPELIDWAKREFEIAQESARAREEWERGREQREREAEERRRERAELDAFWSQYDRLCKAAWEVEDREKFRSAQLESLGLPEDFDEMQPSQSSQKGWRRLLSEFPSSAYGGQNRWPEYEWGRMIRNQKRHGRSRRNEGRKPWFK